MDQKVLEKVPSLSLGRLISSVDDQEIDYQLIEVSHHSIGFAAAKNLDPGMTVSFIPKDVQESYTLLVVSSEAIGNDGKMHKYRAIARKTQVNFEKLCENEIEKYKVASVNKDDWNVRNIRFVTEPALDVDVKTFGSGRSYYHVETANISRSGLLLVSQNKQKLPFNMGTLVEMEIRQSQFYDSLEIKCVGKVVRHTGLEFDAKKQYIGISFNDMDVDSVKRWSELLAKIDLALSIRL